MLGCRLLERVHALSMKKASKVISYRRWPKLRSKAPARRGKAEFVMTVSVVAVAAFTVTMLWPHSATLTSAQAEAGAYDFACDVAYVNDGDTLRCEDGTRVRFHAISARETDGTCSPGHPCSPASAAESKAALERLAGQRITCIQTGRSYNRVTGICQNSSGIEINCAMVQSGAALIWDRFNRQQPICRS